LSVPEKIIWLFQPPYSPEVNPIERFWKALKKELSWSLFDNLDELRHSVKIILDTLTPQQVTSLTNWQFIKDALSVANI
jgi:transposase